MLRSLIWPAFVLVVIAQWFIPSKIIWKKQQIIDKGFTHKFEAAPVDPEDPFRGRYIVLNFAETSLRTKDSVDVQDPDKVYVIFSSNAKGFSVPSSVLNAKPSGSNYLEVATTYISREKDSTFVHLQYPFSDYYMEESKAPIAERIYARRLNDSTSSSYALVKIWNGDAVIQDVFVNDTSIHELIKRGGEPQ